ncbi:fumarate reductase subunit FrdD [Rheinheimera sp. NSM]|uniref:fumarate reductase subunit FrdD n=1 Tax=Rheinheimera sp. NSM TaxID=3457884 RepID=UPI004036E5CE
MNSPKRSDEPIWWALFSAGGVCFAVFLPGLILTLGLLWPLGLLNPHWLTYSALTELSRSTYSIPALLLTGAVVCLPLLHAAHRIHHGLHDLKFGFSQAGKLLCYGLAVLLSLLALVLVVAV